jgi:hypothetical protein
LRRERAAAAVLRTAFPGVQLVRLEMEFQSGGSPPASQSHVLHPPARAFFRFPCPYADCSGELDLSSAVQAALADPAHRVEGTMECTGVRSRKPCQLRLHYIVTASCLDHA